MQILRQIISDCKKNLANIIIRMLCLYQKTNKKVNGI
jgi:hypothetical protein